MYPQEFVPPDLRRLAEEGDARAIVRRRGRTLEEVLQAARDEMTAEDQAEEYRRDPVGYVRAHRPRRNLWQRLMHGKGKP
jgi:hypothetical protein